MAMHRILRDPRTARERNNIPDFCHLRRATMTQYSITGTGFRRFFFSCERQYSACVLILVNVYIADGPSSIIIIQSSDFQPPTPNTMQFVSTYF